MHKKLGNRKGAMADNGKAIEHDPDCWEAYVNRAILHKENGDYQAAFADLSESIRIEPKRLELRRERVMLAAKISDWRQIIDDIDVILAAQPGDKQIIHLRGKAFRMCGDFEQAISDFDAALAIDPLHCESLMMRALANFQSGNVETAMADYRRLLEIDNSYTEVYIDYGQHCAENAEDAINSLDFALAIDPGSFRANMVRSHRFFNDNNYRRAVEALSDAIEINPDDRLARLMRALAYSLSGNSTKSAADLAHLTDAEPAKILPLAASYLESHESARRKELLKQIDDAIEKYPADTTLLWMQAGAMVRGKPHGELSGGTRSHCEIENRRFCSVFSCSTHSLASVEIS